MRIFTFLLLLMSLGIRAQMVVSGTITDDKTGEALPFATITTLTGKTVTGDVDGKFIIEEADNISLFTVSYTGYETKTVNTSADRQYYNIELSYKATTLNELVISNENPAKKIMQEAIRRKQYNDPQQKLKSFRYKMYDRLVVTANPDSISGKLDSLYIYEKAGRRLQKIDSSGFKFKKLIEKQHIYQTEKVSEFNFNDNQGLKETILATRMAGFKQPVYEIIGLTFQSYSVYSNSIEIIETKYAGPLANNAFTDYNYTILDTVVLDSRNTFMVYFTPKNPNKKKKLEGILYIDQNNYGVAKAVFRVRNILDVTSAHYFKYEKEYDLWFPDSNVLKIVKGNNKEDIKILGETITFDAPDENSDREKEASDFIYVMSKSQNFEKEFNIPVKIKHSSVAIEIGREAITREDSYWNRFRDTLDDRSMKTYIALDSIIAKDNWEQRLILGRNIINGYLPVGAVDIDLRDVARYNNYEGFRLGLGGVTNNKFAETFRISGYGVYGTKDGEFKYSLGSAIRLDEFSNTWIGGSYTDDLKEIASTSFITDKRVFKIYDPRPINVSTFYNHQTWRAYVETKMLPKTESVVELTRSRIDPKFHYLYNPSGIIYPVFNLTMATFAVQWNPFSDFMQTPIGRIENEKRFPKFAFQYTQALAGIAGGDFTFGKMDFRAEYEKKYINGQKSSLLIQAGVAIGDAPLTHQYSISPNNLNKETIFSRITFAGKNSFETMYFNEFFSSQFVMMQLKHGLRKFEIYEKIKLSPVVVTRFAWGNMENIGDHSGFQFNTLEKGYYESGIELNEIFMGLGISGFYRYGPYHLPNFDQNITLKVSFILNLGI